MSNVTTKKPLNYKKKALYMMASQFNKIKLVFIHIWILYLYGSLLLAIRMC